MRVDVNRSGGVWLRRASFLPFAMMQGDVARRLARFAGRSACLCACLPCRLSFYVEYHAHVVGWVQWPWSTCSLLTHVRCLLPVPQIIWSTHPHPSLLTGRLEHEIPQTKIHTHFSFYKYIQQLTQVTQFLHKFVKCTSSWSTTRTNLTTFDHIFNTCHIFKRTVNRIYRKFFINTKNFHITLIQKERLSDKLLRRCRNLSIQNRIMCIEIRNKGNMLFAFSRLIVEWRSLIRSWRLAKTCEFASICSSKFCMHLQNWWYKSCAEWDDRYTWVECPIQSDKAKCCHRSSCAS